LHLSKLFRTSLLHTFCYSFLSAAEYLEFEELLLNDRDPFFLWKTIIYS